MKIIKLGATAFFLLLVAAVFHVFVNGNPQAAASNPDMSSVSVTVPGHIKAKAQGAKKAGARELSPEEKLVHITLNLFTSGCVNQYSSLEDWADKQVGLKRAESKDMKDFSGLWKALGYPVPDKLANVWGVMGAPVFLYQHENYGCTITSVADLGPGKLEGFFKAFAKHAEESANMPSVLTSSEDKDSNMTVFLLSFDPGKKEGSRVYFIGRSIKG